MTKEITKAYIIQQIEDRFKLRELVPEKFSFSEMVVPTYDIREHLRTAIVTAKTLSISETGGVEYFKIPSNEEWHLNGYNVIFTGAGAITVAGVYITRTYHSAYFLYLDLTAAQTVSYVVDLPKPVILHSGDTININIDGYTSTQGLYLYIDVVKEEIR